ncbi:hypothetical protein D3C79_760480 [compost metagenome]
MGVGSLGIAGRGVGVVTGGAGTAGVAVTAGGSGTAGVAVAASLISLRAAQHPADIDATAIVQDADELAAWVRQVKRADAVAGAVGGADLGEQGGIDRSRHGRTVCPEPTRRRCSHSKGTDAPDFGVINDLAQRLERLGGGQDLAAVGFRIVAFGVGQVAQLDVVLGRSAGAQVLVVAVAQSHPFDQGVSNRLALTLVGDRARHRHAGQLHHVVGCAVAVGVVGVRLAKHHLPDGHGVTAFAGQRYVKPGFGR